MKRPTFLQNALIALTISFIVTITFHLLVGMFDIELLIRLLGATAALSYTLVQMRFLQIRVGIVTLMAIWLVTTACLFWWNPPTGHFLLLQALMIWFIRSLASYQSTFPSLADLGLSLAGFGVGAWATQHTGSLFLGFWCFFLSQALTAALPDRIQFRSGQTTDQFSKAHRQAMAALQQLSTLP